MATNANLTKLRKKLIPPPDGQDVAKLRAAVVSALNSNGTVDITLNGATVPGVPSLGNAVFVVGTVVQVLSYRGSMLILGGAGRITAQPVEATGSTTNGTTTSTSYTNSLTTTGTHGVVFIAPPSGRVQILGRASAGSSTVGQYAQLDWEVRAGGTIGSGTLARTTNNNTASVFLSSTSGGQGPLNISGLLSGLTPGATYNACLTYASSSGSSTASFNRRQIAVYPL